jgi:formate dehydrogenase gamma subunit
MKKNEKKIYRQSLSNRLVHWITAVSILILIISGLGQMPIYKRYNVVKLPGAEWLGDYTITLILHYLAAIILIFIVFYHMFVHLIQKQFDIFPKRGDGRESIKIIKAMLTKGEEPPSEKYLAEQRLAYLAIGMTVIALVVTGLIKMAKNLDFISITHPIIYWATMIHNIATFAMIFLIIGHMAAFLIKANRKLLPGMFSGYVDKEYVKHRHSLWYKRINEQNTKANKKRSTAV